MDKELEEKKEPTQTSYAEPWSSDTFRPEEQGKPKPAGEISHVIKVCRGINCSAKHSEILFDSLKNRFSPRPDVDVSYCYCLGHCARGSNVVINGSVVNYVSEKGLDFILKKHVERHDELKKSGLTSEELDTILFGTGI